MAFIKSIKANPTTITLKKLDSPIPEILLTDKESISIGFLDTETTGINCKNDKIIELAIKVVQFEKLTGKIISINQIYESFNDPKQEIKQEITLLTGIDNKMVNGHSINWKDVDSLLENTDFIVSHNASFDRAFIDRYSSISQNTIWACSVNDINWLKRGFTSQKQELLCYWHGFYFNSHRAMNDVDALINLLTHNSYKDDRPILELIKNAYQPEYLIFAENFNYDSLKKDTIKANKYKWNPDKKLWYKKINLDDLEDEKSWITNIIYDTIFEGRIEETNLIDKYKL